MHLGDASVDLDEAVDVATALGDQAVDVATALGDQALIENARARQVIVTRLLRAVMPV